jgi:large subunit ribosomal protein L27
MAHKKAAGSKSAQGSNVPGKRLGLKAASGESVTAGSILVRQVGNLFHPGQGVGQGRDFTLFAKIAGKVSFKEKLGRRFINIDGGRIR